MTDCASSGQLTRPPQPFSAVVGALIIAHRGGALEAPENTMAAVRNGVSQGSDWQEIDVTLSRDGKVVVIHDDTVDRTTDGTGRVADLTASELTSLSADKPQLSPQAVERLSSAGVPAPDFGERFVDERIPLLPDVLRIADARLMIEMKSTDEPGKLAEAVIKDVHRAGMADRVALASFQSQLLDAAYARDPSLPLIGIASTRDAVVAMLRLPVSAVAVPEELAIEIMQHVPAGVAVWGWTVYTPQRAEELALAGVHGIITDSPGAVVKKLRTLPDPVMGH